MEMELSKAYAFRRINVSRSVVSGCGISLHRKIQCPEGLFLVDKELQNLRKKAF